MGSTHTHNDISHQIQANTVYMSSSIRINWMHNDSLYLIIFADNVSIYFVADTVSGVIPGLSVAVAVAIAFSTFCLIERIWTLCWSQNNQDLKHMQPIAFLCVLVTKIIAVECVICSFTECVFFPTVSYTVLSWIFPYFFPHPSSHPKFNIL